MPFVLSGWFTEQRTTQEKDLILRCSVGCLARLNVKGPVKRLSLRTVQPLFDLMMHETGSW